MSRSIDCGLPLTIGGKPTAPRTETLKARQEYALSEMADLGYITKEQADAAKAFKKAVTGLVEFTEKNPNYSDGFYLLGNAYFSDNQLQKAMEAYRRCLEISPRFSKARHNLGVVHVKRREKDKALEQYNALLNLDKNLADSLKTAINSM